MEKNKLLKQTSIAIIILAVFSIIAIPFYWMFSSISWIVGSFFFGIFKSLFAVIAAIISILVNAFKIYAGYRGYRNAGDYSKMNTLYKFGLVMLIIDVLNLISNFGVIAIIRVVLSGLYTFAVKK